jgi:chemotaxis protein MotB
VVPQGLRILIKDDQQRFMFERGSVQLNPHFATLLGRLAGVLAKVGNKLIISGHTDSVPYKVKGYNNWNLSGDRALRARNVMVDSGLASASVLQVAAQADVMPLRPEAPEDGVNRRIEILMLTAKAEGLYRELFGDRQVRVEYAAEKTRLVLPNSVEQQAL